MTNQPVKNATVAVAGVDAEIVARTGEDGSYTLDNVPAGEQMIRVFENGYNSRLPSELPPPPIDPSGLIWDRAHAGYFRERTAAVKSDATVPYDMVLEHINSLDWARCAVVNVSSNLRDRYDVNDGNPTTGWRPASGRVYGEWVELTWSEPLSISAIVVHSSGPVEDYTVQYSMDEATWTDLRRVISTESGLYGPTGPIGRITIPPLDGMTTIVITINKVSGRSWSGSIW